MASRNISIKDFLKHELKETIDEIVYNPEAFLKTLSINRTSRIDNRAGKLRIFYVLGVETNIVELVFAKNHCLKKRIEDKLRGEIKERYGLENVFVYIDVNRPQQVLKQSKPRVYSAVSIKDGLDKGIISKDSPMANFCSEFGINHMLLGGEWLMGPSVELAYLINLVVPKWEPAHMLDLFCGTGAISKVALMHGAHKVTCVDLHIKIASQTLKDLSQRARLIERDVFNLDFDQYYDLIVADPPHILALKVAEELADRIMRSTDLFMFYHGHSEQVRWNKQIRDILRKKCEEQVEVDKNGASITILSRGKRGNNFLKMVMPSVQTWTE